MDVREKLVELLERAFESFMDDPYCIPDEREFADHLIAHGVTVQNNTEINDELLEQLRNAPITILQEEPTIEMVQEWISVKDRLPDKDGCYIVTACDEGCSCGDGIWYDTVVIEAEHYKGEWSWNENGTEYDITDFVTHWQPMPQPPKGE